LSEKNNEAAVEIAGRLYDAVNVGIVVMIDLSNEIDA
jgi:hypothetical protein